MTEYPYPRPDPDEMDREAVRLGWMTEEERISAAYARIHARQLRRRGRSPLSRPTAGTERGTP
jgi:hypothetical protein